MDSRGTPKSRRNTRQRTAILGILKSVKTHPTADELFMIVRRQLPKISLGTVYRNLERLREEGEIREIRTTDSRLRFDGDMSEHHHFHCVRCGKVEDVRLAGLPDPRHLGYEPDGREIRGYSLILEGVCAQCGNGAGKGSVKEKHASRH